MDLTVKKRSTDGTDWLTNIQRKDQTTRVGAAAVASGSGGTFGSEVSTAVERGPSGTFATPPQGVAVRLNDLFTPRRMEFKGWVTDYKQCRYQGLTDTEVSNLINDLHKMVPDALKKIH